MPKNKNGITGPIKPTAENSTLTIKYLGMKR
jgi:hypothetical protein